jgi:integrator complex subunit 11
MDQELVEYYEHQQVTRALDNALLVHHGQSVRVSHNIQVTAFYAGHVIGALMYLIEINGKRVFFTGDFNFTPDRHLGAAKPPRIYTDVVISESTYSDVVMDSKKLRERQLIEQVTKCLAGGGKVLFPVYAVGRAQELCMILESAWESLPKDSRVPLYFTRGIAAQANAFYKAFVSWTCDDVKRISLTKSVFDFSHIEEISVHDIKMKSGPMIIFATPAMLHSGTSLEIFKFLAPDERNLVVLAGLCVKGTLGHEMMSGKKQITIKDEKISVKCTISRISFSAHTDSKGIVCFLKIFLSLNFKLDSNG